MAGSILELLKRDHVRALELMKEIESAKSVEEGSLAFDRLSKLLTAHTAAEVDIFYPAIQTEENELQVEQAYDVHDGVAEILDTMQQMNFESTEFKAMLHQLRDAFVAHSQEEEDQMFATARQIFSEEELIALGAESQMVKDDEMDAVSMEQF
jgi:hemerythrin superfamily protein